MNEKLSQRLKEPSTWRGIALVATAFGVTISPDLLEYIIAAGTGLSGLVGVLTADSKQQG